MSPRLNSKYTKPILGQSLNTRANANTAGKTSVANYNSHKKIIEASVSPPQTKKYSSTKYKANNNNGGVVGRRNLKQWLTDDNYVKNIVLK